jgi:hypothetical protein
MLISRFNRWSRRRTKPSEQVYDAAPYETQVISVEISTAKAAEAERELTHANEQLELQSKYPGRSRTPDNVIAIKDG